ncbi:uncharacterized protein [Aegilops tauschii subsp. strangulata]|uniref:uncharacterized protein isoform X2 n=1 Tax=Aegilops tauschii subsp. strangulata TaxID=200361 RepID=UPI00098B17C9|nr:ribonuclease III domain-containing protein RNC1, chloroplastic isoform X2 [Aegilops tauschii subsp. strangulata]XP_044416508.1 ribonuclease III domain-containing protein RNC1, chloroplastic-like isoform X2 [Triticum aestivum]
MARAPHQLPLTLRRISRTTTGPSMAWAPTPAPSASPAMAQAVWRPCSCPAPAVSEVAHRKKAVSPKKKYPRPILAAIRRRPYLDGCLLEAKLAWLRQSGFLGVNTVCIHPVLYPPNAHWRLCIKASASLHRA